MARKLVISKAATSSRPARGAAVGAMRRARDLTWEVGVFDLALLPGFEPKSMLLIAVDAACGEITFADASTRDVDESLLRLGQQASLRRVARLQLPQRLIAAARRAGVVAGLHSVVSAPLAREAFASFERLIDSMAADNAMPSPALLDLLADAWLAQPWSRGFDESTFVSFELDASEPLRGRIGLAGTVEEPVGFVVLPVESEGGASDAVRLPDAIVMNLTTPPDAGWLVDALSRSRGWSVPGRTPWLTEIRGEDAEPLRAGGRSERTARAALAALLAALPGLSSGSRGPVMRDFDGAALTARITVDGEPDDFSEQTDSFILTLGALHLSGTFTDSGALIARARATDPVVDELPELLLAPDGVSPAPCVVIEVPSEVLDALLGLEVRDIPVVLHQTAEAEHPAFSALASHPGDVVTLVSFAVPGAATGLADALASNDWTLPLLLTDAERAAPLMLLVVSLLRPGEPVPGSEAPPAARGLALRSYLVTRLDELDESSEPPFGLAEHGHDDSGPRAAEG